MTILVLGATGFIGQQVLLTLSQAGHPVTGLGRDTGRPAPVFPLQPGSPAISARSAKQRTGFALDGVTAVINCAGALQDGLRDDLVAVQRDAMLALQQAVATHATPPLIIQISAPENLASAGTAFMTTKLEADRALAASGLPYVILRPTVVVGRNAYGGTALLRAIASFPGVLPLVDAKAR